LDLKEALYYETEDNQRVRCYLCPHKCLIKPDQKGICRVRVNRAGYLYTLNYGQLTSLALDPIEKKPLYHFYPGDLTRALLGWRPGHLDLDEAGSPFSIPGYHFGQ
jgi:pyruvate formate lyase activating enzyme